ncbi:MAG: hypothetical protein K0R39_4733 [Symbiobacteriaceae bacterium]|jgi:uncharacterized protein YoxC|nr:hypothetical protein [Symbiobacteriaceae bacterium]
MLGQVAKVVCAVVLGAAVASSALITRYLTLLENGIRRDIEAVDKIVAVEREIQRQNDVLTDMVATTQRIGTGLDGVLATTERIHSSVAAVGVANRSTLELNTRLESDNGAAARELSRVVASLQAMNQSTTAINQYLKELAAVVDDELDALSAVASNTARMNLKTPEVDLP